MEHLPALAPIPKRKHEPVSDIDTGAEESLKALDPDQPIREADMSFCTAYVGF